MNPYEVLGLAQDASIDDAKRAFRKLARKHHPDLHPDDPQAGERFKKINAAYEAIRTGKAGGSGQARGGFGGGPNADYVDGVWLMAEHQLQQLVRDTLPTLVEKYGFGHRFSLELAIAARAGELPTGGGTFLGRIRVRRTFKQLHLRLADDRFGGRIIRLHQNGQDTVLILSPSALWASGARDDEMTREVIKLALAMGLAAAAPLRLSLLAMAQSPEQAAEMDKGRDLRRGLQAGLWIFVVVFAVGLIGSSMLG